MNLDVKNLDKDNLRLLDDFIDKTADKKKDIIAILHKAQMLFGFLPPNLQLYISRKVDLHVSKVNGIVSFYSFFNEERSGKYTVNLCMGTACFVKGADKVLDKFGEVFSLEGKETMSKDTLFSLRPVRCVGACGLAPVAMINDDIIGHIEVEDVVDIVEEYRKKETNNED